jgi:hypothetical protein
VTRMQRYSVRFENGHTNILTAQELLTVLLTALANPPPTFARSVRSFGVQHCLVDCSPSNNSLRSWRNLMLVMRVGRSKYGGLVAVAHTEQQKRAMKTSINKWKNSELRYFQACAAIRMPSAAWQHCVLCIPAAGPSPLGRSTCARSAGSTRYDGHWSHVLVFGSNLAPDTALPRRSVPVFCDRLRWCVDGC